MSDIVPLFISILALLGTFYQLHLQRVHNERSLKPLPQIDFVDREGLVFIRIQNSGVGPMIIEKLQFVKGKERYSRIQDALNADPKSYDHIDIDSANRKIIFPGSYIEILSKKYNDQYPGDMDLFRQQLSLIELKVFGLDIYNNKVAVEKSLSWFGRHLSNNS